MKLLTSTRQLLHYQFWCDQVALLMQIVSKGQSHRWPEQFERAYDQAMEASSFAAEWKNKWTGSLV